MSYILIKRDNVVITKGVNYTGNLVENEIEITEEQFNQIDEFPLKLILNENGQVVAWEKTELPVEEYVEPIKQPTIEERLTIAEDTINFLLGL